jgi:hypothetical protein
VLGGGRGGSHPTRANHIVFVRWVYEDRKEYEMQNRRLVYWLALALTATLAGVRADRASADVGEIQRIPFTTVTFSPCTPDNILVTGEWQIVGHVTRSDNEGFHAGLLINCHGTGIGLNTGAQYLFNQTLSMSLNAGAPFPFISTQSLHETLVGQGSVPNLNVTSLAHITVNANGELSVTFSDFEIDCHG